MGPWRAHERLALAWRFAGAAVPHAGRGAALLRRAPRGHGHRHRRGSADPPAHAPRGEMASRVALATGQRAHDPAFASLGAARGRRARERIARGVPGAFHHRHRNVDAVRAAGGARRRGLLRRLARSRRAHAVVHERAVRGRRRAHRPRDRASSHVHVRARRQRVRVPVRGRGRRPVALHHRGRAADAAPGPWAEPGELPHRVALPHVQPRGREADDARRGREPALRPAAGVMEARAGEPTAPVDRGHRWRPFRASAARPAAALRDHARRARRVLHRPAATLNLFPSRRPETNWDASEGCLYTAISFVVRPPQHERMLAYSMNPRRNNNLKTRLYILVAAALFVFGSHKVFAQVPQYGPNVTFEQAKKVLAAAEADTRCKGWQMAIAIVDNACMLVAFSKQDNTQNGSVLIAQDKAASSAL